MANLPNFVTNEFFWVCAWFLGRVGLRVISWQKNKKLELTLNDLSTLWKCFSNKNFNVYSGVTNSYPILIFIHVHSQIFVMMLWYWTNIHRYQPWYNWELVGKRYFLLQLFAFFIALSLWASLDMGVHLNITQAELRFSGIFCIFA